MPHILLKRELPPAATAPVDSTGEYSEWADSDIFVLTHRPLLPRTRTSSVKRTIPDNVVAFGTSGIRVLPPTATTANLLNNCVFGNETNYVMIADATGTNGNISLDPETVELGSGLFLSPGSPCRGTGEVSLVQPDWVDLLGRPRITAGRVNIGEAKRLSKPSASSLNSRAG